MTRVFLAAGVAALAIAAPATAGPGGHGGKDRVTNQVQGGGGGQRAQATERRGGGGGGVAAQERAARVQQFSAPRVERQQRIAAAPQRAERIQMRTERQQARPAPIERAQTRVAQRPAPVERQTLRAERQAQVQTRTAERQAQVQTRAAERQAARTTAIQRQAMRANRVAPTQTTVATRQQVQPNRMQQVQTQAQTQVAARDRVAQVQARIAARTALMTRVDPVRAAAPLSAALLPARTTVTPVAQAVQYVGQPVSTVTNVVQLQPLPTPAQYLYPDTPDYYYQYGDGYVYQVDRTSNLIAALIPLLTGGYMPGQYLPSSYMGSYMPDYYGFNSFYPDSPYTCNRYYNGVIYQVDCITGMVENVIPMYAGGYGVGQMLPSSYGYYNVPNQYRSMYYDTPDYNYWYAPGAIYQYDPSSSMITSVAALLSPGFTVGQPLPMGYDTYNVPYAYRQTYYDTPNAWYRYNNGYIYQIDPTTQLVSAIVASILT